MRFFAALIFGTVSLHAGTLSFTTFPSISSTEGSIFNGVLGTFTDSNTSDTASTFTGIVNWGDGTTSTPTITGGLGTFSLSGGHTYAEEGTYSVVLNVIDVAADSATGTGTATLADAALSPLNVPPPLDSPRACRRPTCSCSGLVTEILFRPHPIL